MRRLEPVVIEPTTSPRPLGVSSLLSFARCPLQYYYEDVLGLPESDQYEGPGVYAEAFTTSKGLSAAARGMLMHRFCELYDAGEEWEALLLRLVDEQVMTTDMVNGARAREEAFADLRPLAEHYVNGQIWQQMEDTLKDPVEGRVESEVSFIYHTGTIPLRGRIDKLIVDRDGRATIIDFKTNRVDREQVDAVAGEYELQIRTYALAARRALRLKRVRGVLYFLGPDVQFEVDPERLDEAETAREVDELCRQILTVRHFQDVIARPAPDRCHHCRCFSFCPSRAV